LQQKSIKKKVDVSILNTNKKYFFLINNFIILKTEVQMNYLIMS